MQKKHLIAAVLFAAALPALAGTITAALAGTVAMRTSDDMQRRKAAAGQPVPPARSDDQKHMPAVKPSGLLNTTTPPRQAKAITRDTNRKIAQGQITPQVSPPEVTQAPAH